MAKFGDRVKETTDTTGTGTLDLNGAPTGFLAFADEFTDQDDEISYLIVDDPDSPTEWEAGKGTFVSGSPHTFQRDTVERSSNSNNKVSFSSGTKTIVAVPTAGDFAAVFGDGGWGTKSGKVRAITSDDNQVAADDGKLIDADASGNSPATLTYTLLAEATAGDGFVGTIRNDGASGTVDVDDDAGALIATLQPGESITLRCDGTKWHEASDFLATVSQAEAEAGTATLRRAWTAERVKQAIEALATGVNDLLLYQDQATSGTDGPTYTADSWQTVPIDTEVIDTATIGSVASNAITLEAGSYEFEGFALVGNGSSASVEGRLRLRNTTDGTTVVQGVNAAQGAGSSDGYLNLRIHGQFTIAAQKVFELQVYPNEATTAPLAVGSGEVEVYASIRFRRYST